MRKDGQEDVTGGDGDRRERRTERRKERTDRHTEKHRQTKETKVEREEVLLMSSRDMLVDFLIKRLPLINQQVGTENDEKGEKEERREEEGRGRREKEQGGSKKKERDL